MKRFKTMFLILIFIGFLFTGCLGEVSDPLTPGERAWLTEHDGKILIDNERGSAPFIDIDENGEPYGISVDYYKLIEEKLGFSFQVDDEDLWVNILDRMEKRDIDVLCAVQENENWAGFALFTEPYIEVPNVIIVQSGRTEEYSLDDLKGLRIAVSENYAVHFYLMEHYPEINLIPVIDDKACLYEVAAGNVEAAVVHLAIASFAMEQEGLSNLRIAGDAGYNNTLSFASRSDWPVLNSILQKGFDQITPQEHLEISRRWINIDYTSFFMKREFKIIAAAVIGIIVIIIVSALIWSKALKNTVDKRTIQLKESEQRYRSLVDTVPGTTYRTMIDKDWTVLFVSAEIEKLTGYPASDFLSGRRTMGAVQHPDDKEYIWNTVQQAVSELREYNLTYRMIKANGTVIWVSEKGKATYDGNGEPMDLVGVITDISEMKKQEDEIKQLQGYLADIIDSMPSILIGIDRLLVVNMWNRKAEEDSEVTSDEACGRGLFELFPRLKPFKSIFLESMKSGGIESLKKIPYHSRNGSRFEDIVIYPLITGGETKAVIRLDDVTEVVRLEEIMIQSEKMLSVGGLAAGMAHEINNPLAGMIQNASILSNRLGTGDDSPMNRKNADEAGLKIDALKKYMEAREIPRITDSIIESGRRIAEVVSNMLSFAASGSDSRSTHDLGEIVDKSLTLASTDYNLKKRFDFRRIKIKKNYEPGTPPVPCESSKIQQVLLNIFRNGAYAMKEAETSGACFSISIMHLKERAMVVLEIENNGPSLSEEVRKRLFDPFFTTKPTGIGTGLGLSVSYFIIVENHEGEFEVESDETQGVKFIIRLPI